MGPGAMTFEHQEMPADGKDCLRCKEPIYGKMVQYFLFDGDNLEPMATRFKMCLPCFKIENDEANA